jgi:hypothetical protein
VRRGHALVFWFSAWDHLGLVGQPGEFGPAVYSSQEARWALEYVGKLNSVWWLCIENSCRGWILSYSASA